MEWLGASMNSKSRLHENKNCRANCRSAPSVLKQLKNNRGYFYRFASVWSIRERGSMESGVAQFAFRSAKALLACSRMGAGGVLKQDQKLGLGKRRARRAGVVGG